MHRWIIIITITTVMKILTVKYALARAHNIKVILAYLTEILMWVREFIIQLSIKILNSSCTPKFQMKIMFLWYFQRLSKIMILYISNNIGTWDVYTISKYTYVIIAYNYLKHHPLGRNFWYLKRLLEFLKFKDYPITLDRIYLSWW